MAAKLVPVIVTEVLTAPDVGFRPVMDGPATITVRVAAALVTVPAELLTTTVKVDPLSEAVVAGVV